jgi:predicted negative regulator of RcsB-dependent stress response
MHPALIFFIVFMVLAIIIIAGFFGYKYFQYKGKLVAEQSLLGDTLEFLELYKPQSFDDPQIKNFEKMTANERKQVLENLKKNK